MLLFICRKFTRKYLYEYIIRYTKYDLYEIQNSYMAYTLRRTKYYILAFGFIYLSSTVFLDPAPEQGDIYH